MKKASSAASSTTIPSNRWMKRPSSMQLASAPAIVTVEEHQKHAGMGSRVAEILAQNRPVPIEFVGVADRFGQSGDPAELIDFYGMGAGAIKDAVRHAHKRKNASSRAQRHPERSARSCVILSGARRARSRRTYGEGLAT